MAEQKSYADDFKRKIVELVSSGRSISAISREYEISKSTVSTWCKQHKNSGSFRAADNLSESEKELKLLRKENKQLRMENDILKQAALIMGRKGE